MNKYFHFISEQPIHFLNLRQVLSENYNGDLSFEQTDETSGYIFAEGSFFDVIDQLLPVLNNDFGFNLTVLASHQDGPVARKAVVLAKTKSKAQCSHLGDFLLDLKMDGSNELDSLIKNEFSRIDHELLLTARMFVRCGLNASLASNKMYIHRNTFNYRLGKFIALTGLDIRDYHHALYFVIGDKISNLK